MRLLWAALLHLTAFGCLPPAVTDLLPTSTSATVWPLLVWQPAGSQGSTNTAVPTVAAAYHQWAEQQQEQQEEEGEAALRAVMEWNLATLSLPQSEKPPCVPVWVAWGLGRLSTLRAALQLAAKCGCEGALLWLQRGEQHGGMPAAELAAARVGVLVACLVQGEEAGEAGDGERQLLLFMVRDCLSRLLGREDSLPSAAAASTASTSTLPARSLEEEVLSLAEALLRSMTKDPSSSSATPGAKALAAFLLARLRLCCRGGGGLGAAAAGLRQHLMMTTAAADGEGLMERVSLWLELLALSQRRRQEESGKSTGSNGGSASSSALEATLTAAMLDLTAAAPAPPESTTASYDAAVLWALNGRPRRRRIAARAVQALIQGVLHDLPQTESTLPLLERCCLQQQQQNHPAALPSCALVTISHALLAHALGRPSRAGSLLRLRAVLAPRVLRRLTQGWRLRDRGGGGAFGNDEGMDEAVCLAQVELAVQEAGRAQVALERASLLDPVAAAAWTALLHLEACLGSGGEEGGGQGAGRLSLLVKGLRAVGVHVSMLFSTVT